MYFIERSLFDRLTDAGLEVPGEAQGIFQLRGVPGVLVNPDALTLDQLNAHANTLANTPGGDSTFHLGTTEEGLWNVVLTPGARPGAAADRQPAGAQPRRPRNARRSPPAADPQPTEPSREPDLLDDAAEASRTPRSASFREIRGGSPRTPHREPAIDTSTQAVNASALALVNFYRSRLPGRLKIVRRDDVDRHLCGLPDPAQYLNDPATDKLIAVGAVPGTGTYDVRRRRTVRTLDSQRGEAPMEIEIPPAQVPEGMTPVRIQDVTVGCYDRRMLVIFAEAASLIRMIAPTWLEAFTVEPEPADDTQADLDRLVAAHRRPRENHTHEIDMLRDRIARARQTLTESRARREAFDAMLENRAPRFDRDRVFQQVEQLMESDVWRVETNGGTPAFQLRDLTVRDPRDGSLRQMPFGVEVTLASMLGNHGPFRGQPNMHNHHPRLFGSGFLSAEVDTAFSDCVNDGDIVAALELARDVLTSFSADDPDVAALDSWPLAQTTEEGTEPA